MPIMTRMRDSMPVILFTLLIVFVLTIIFDWGMGYLGLRGPGAAEDIGKVNGKAISYREFADVLRNYAESQKQQTGKEPTEDELKTVRDQIWQSMVSQRLMMEEASRLGVTVTDQEIIDWVRGDNPPEDLRRNFVDSTGQFRRDVYDQFLSNPNQFLRDPEGSDPNYGSKWLAEYDKSLRQRRLQEKVQSVVLASVGVTEGEVMRRFADQNQRMSAVVAFVDAGTAVPDSTVQVTDADIRTFYDENIESYKVPASRMVKYVVFPIAPTASDSAARIGEMNDVAKKARAGADFIDLTGMYSDTRDSGAYFKHGEISPGLEGEVFAAKPGDIVGPLTEGNTLHLFKVLDARKSANEYIRASHILFRMEGDSNAVKELAQRVAREAKGGADFGALARQYSKDPGNAGKGGDLGWFSKGRMVPQFEKAAFGARVGEVVGPVRTAFGLHIIKVTGRDSRELKLVSIKIPIEASAQTRNDLLDRSRDFAYNSRETDLPREAEQLGMKVQEAPVTESGAIPGLGVDEAVNRWAFAEKVGSVSEPFSIQNSYVVFAITDAKDAGARPFDELKESLRPLALRSKKLERATAIAADLRSKLGPADSVSGVAEFNPAVTITRTGEFTFSGGIPLAGRDPAFIGAISALQVGQISPAVKGARGAYLIQLLSRTEIDSAAYSSQSEMLRTRLLQEKRNRFLADWMDSLRKNAEIEDKRDLFYR
jgi:peptidyl-prolyl cis-trans isomerase D